MRNLKPVSKGFTLIEVLVASMILFATIASISLLYSGSLVASEKSNRHIEISNILPIAIKQIRYNVRSRTQGNITDLSGKNYFWGVEVNWQAVRVSYKPPPPLYSFDLGKHEKQNNKYFLWNITAVFKLDNYSREYQFKEVSWNEN
ncbi:PulJ/GspJ family protein [Pseudoalteromonas aurantia]|uniref:Prepilin-type N-terminal cleavage/methylation domain-containing protein n=1 Tax=Pseudoalteromonas aurantia 208 TaxID=1314867 RepID=A0ABR9EE77_9GAMM|nr:prepilin-type N-terminal cleavage/methylation domain-containing protein [Pseudoalteromonas aurantia]MBE0369296.1 hypothetical protein [Pseudoalteromonas aurantia 208]